MVPPPGAFSPIAAGSGTPPRSGAMSQRRPSCPPRVACHRRAAAMMGGPCPTAARRMAPRGGAMRLSARPSVSVSVHFLPPPRSFLCVWSPIKVLPFLERVASSSSTLASSSLSSPSHRARQQRRRRRAAAAAAPQQKRQRARARAGGTGAAATWSGPIRGGRPEPAVTPTRNAAARAPTVARRRRRRSAPTRRRCRCPTSRRHRRGARVGR